MTALSEMEECYVYTFLTELPHRPLSTNLSSHLPKDDLIGSSDSAAHFKSAAMAMRIQFRRLPAAVDSEPFLLPSRAAMRCRAHNTINLYEFDSNWLCSVI